MTDLITHPPTPQTSASPVVLGIKGLCPHCGQGKLFSGLLTVAPSCEVCGLDYSFADSADGPAVFVMLLAGALVAGVALYMEFTYEPVWWVHALVQVPLITLVCLAMLRPFKGVLITLQYANKAVEERFKAP
jgi:uncharacterized protein (DUF983 family)